MDIQKEKAIRIIVSQTIKSFASGFEARHEAEVDDPEGSINMKKNNCFINVLGNEFIFYSAFVRSFDSSFGTVLESLGNAIAKFSYETNHTIRSYMLPEQTQHISSILDMRIIFQNQVLNIMRISMYYNLVIKQVLKHNTNVIIGSMIEIQILIIC